MSATASPIVIWCLMRDQFAHVKAVEDYFGKDAAFIYDGSWNSEAMVQHAPDLVVCVNDYAYDISVCLDAARRARIPSLVLQDGILEWRCQYENPLFGAGGNAPQHQPVIADKIACIGEQSGRHIGAWGNASKVEVTGMPRLDHLIGTAVTPPNRPGRQILVMTAKNPGFTPQQRSITIQSLRDVKQYLDTVSGVTVVWRVREDVAVELGVENRLQDYASRELADVIRSSDAVITTPSTAMLEAMLLNRPVAALDYHNVPRFVPSGWTISAAGHIPVVVREILDPPASKMSFQRTCLRDCLRCDGPSAPRVAELMKSMVARAREIRASDRPWGLPAGLLANGRIPEQTDAPELAALYPDQPVFADSDLVSLQVRNARLQAKVKELERELQHRSLASGMYRMGKVCAEYIRSKAARSHA